MLDAVIVGAGLSGLAAACELKEHDLSYQVLEASDAVGGRARTDLLAGFLLDRGFQVLLTSYPEAKRQLDYPSLQLGNFLPGALVRYQGRFHSVADPWRKPSTAFTTMAAPIGSLLDKLRIAQLRRFVTRTTLPEIMRSPETSTIAFLRDYGFSDAIVERFLRPFFGGIFLERQLETSSRMFQFVYRMFADGVAV